MNLRIDSIPRQNTIACAIHMIPNPIQPSNDNPANPYCAVSAYGANPGHNLIANNTNATDARYVWMPYQATAINPRMIAGMFAPNTPNEIRDATGYGVPVACDGRATRLHRKYTIVIPTNNAISTCHAANPNANNGCRP